MMSVKQPTSRSPSPHQPTSCNPPQRQFGQGKRHGVLLKSTTPRQLFG